MKKMAIIITALIITSACGTSQNTVKEKEAGNISRAENKIVLTSNEYNEMVNILKNKEAKKENRLKSLYVLEEKKYPELKSLLEELIPLENIIKFELIESSFKIRGFKYDKNDRLEVLKYALKERSYDAFIDIYTADDIEVITEDSFEIMGKDIEKKKIVLKELNNEIKKLDGERLRLNKRKTEKEKEELIDKKAISAEIEKEKEKELEKILEEKNLKETEEKEIIAKIETKKRYIEELERLIKEAEKNNQQELKNILSENKNISQKDIEKENEILNEFKPKMEVIENKIQLINKKYEMLYNKKLLEETEKSKSKEAEKKEILKNYDEKIALIVEKIEETKKSIQENENDIEKISKELDKKDKVLVLTQEDLTGIINMKNKERSFSKLTDIAVKSNNYYLFKKLSDLDLMLAIANVSDKKFEWIEELLISNQDKYLFVLDYIGTEDYPKYKSIIYHYFRNTSLMKESVDVIIQNEGFDNSKIFDTNYFMQFAAIREYGLNNSKELFEKELNSNPRFEVYRGLALIRYPEVYNIVRKKYNETKDVNLLEVMYFIRTEDSREFLIESLVKKDEESQRDFIKRISIYNKEDSLRLTHEIISKILYNKDLANVKIMYLDYLFEEEPSFFIRGVLKLIENKSLTDIEKKYMIQKLNEYGGEDTSGQILKTLENEEYQRYEAMERKNASFTAKMNLWKEYLNNYPNTYFKDRIEQRISMYNTKVEELKQSVKFSVEQQKIQINERIAAYKDMLRDESDISTIYSIEDRIRELEKTKVDIEKEANLGTKDRLILLQNEYFKHEDEINKLHQHISALQQSGKENKEIAGHMDNMRNTEFKKSITLEKAILVYGIFIDENKGKLDESFLNKDFLRELKGLSR